MPVPTFCSSQLNGFVAVVRRRAASPRERGRREREQRQRDERSATHDARSPRHRIRRCRVAGCPLCRYGRRRGADRSTRSHRRARRALAPRASCSARSGARPRRARARRAAGRRAADARPARRGRRRRLADATLQAFADTMIPGRKAPTHRPRQRDPPAGDRRRRSRAGAVEADALRALPRPADRLRRARARVPRRPRGALARRTAAPFLDLAFDKRVAVCVDGPRLRQPDRAGLGGRRRGAVHRLLRRRDAAERDDRRPRPATG